MNNPRDLPYRLGVGALLLNAQNQVFVAQRIDSPGDAWQMPQGGMDQGEDPRDTVLRELKEEIGSANAKILAESDEWFTYDLPDDLSRGLWGGKYRGQRQKWFALRFLGSDAEVDLTAHEPPEFSRWKWVDYDAVPDLIVPFKRELYQNIMATFHALVKKG